MATPCGFTTDCSTCYNQGRCSDNTCLGFVPLVEWLGESKPFMFINHGQCTIDCPYLQACHEAREWDEEKNIIRSHMDL